MQWFWESQLFFAPLAVIAAFIVYLVATGARRKSQRCGAEQSTIVCYAGATGRKEKL